MSKLICTSCGSVNKVKRETRGSFFIEILLWLCFIFPGLIYSIWRLTTRFNACKVCNGKELIPDDSILGHKLMKELEGEVISKYEKAQ